MILLVTNQRDLTTDYIVRELQERKVSYFRLNTETISAHKCSIGYKSLDDWNIGDVEGKSVSSAYFRRPSAPICRLASLNNEEQEYVQMEWLAFLKGIYSRLDGKWFSSPTNISLAEDKPRQLLIANRIGFKIPQSIITNNFSDVISRTSNENLIAKPLRQALISGYDEKVVFTSRIPKITPEHEESISFAPLIFQQEVIKKFDVRVTVVGHKVFPVAIWSQETTETEVDWRKGGNINLVHEHIDIPSSIEKKCIELVNQLNLGFGAIDLICDKNNNYWFLEINPNGQWAWIENQTKLPIASTIVDNLLRIGECNNEH
ncbi:hypothetical protein RJP56_14155 [Shewanella baltica]|uniref:hypothetical protein n=1 Tax=Shewanella baltica TaxID=62322 RepID=UPI0028713172|nr:hypothetical protein [Shewanella baltica]MDR9767202.1 hypothetical protein [Shewanella baltica]